MNVLEESPKLQHSEGRKRLFFELVFCGYFVLTKKFFVSDTSRRADWILHEIVQIKMICVSWSLVAWTMPLGVGVELQGAGKSSSHQARRAITPRHRRSRTHLVMTNENEEVAMNTLSKDEQAVAVSAIRVTQALFASRPIQAESKPEDEFEEDGQVADLSVGDILAFCGVKGVPVQSNFWDRKWLLQKAREYAAWENAARLKSGVLWNMTVDKRKVRLLHDVCNGEGDATYIDPRSGYTVFSAFAHLRRGHCCGVVYKGESGKDSRGFERTHRCRHCPYTHDGRLTSTQGIALMNRLRVVRFVRENRTADWQTLARSAGLFSISGSQSCGLTIDAESGSGTSETKAIPQRASGTPNTLEAAVGSLENKRRLQRKLVVRVFEDGSKSRTQGEKEEKGSCKTCGGERVTTCTRCKGWTAVFSPRVQKCRQCNGEGMHPCMSCTLFRPPPLSTLYS